MKASGGEEFDQAYFRAQQLQRQGHLVVGVPLDCIMQSELAPMAWVDLGNMRAALEGILLIAKGSQGQAAVVDSYAEQKEKRIGGEHNESGERA